MYSNAFALVFVVLMASTHGQMPMMCELGPLRGPIEFCDEPREGRFMRCFHVLVNGSYTGGCMEVTQKTVHLCIDDACWTDLYPEFCCTSLTLANIAIRRH